MNSYPIRAHRLKVCLQSGGFPTAYIISYHYDDLFVGELPISLAYIPTNRELAFIAFSAAAIMATLGQVETVECDFAIDPSWLDEAQCLLSMLYDVRSATDKTTPIAPPKWTFPSPIQQLDSLLITDKVSDPQNVVCLFSGGNDSSLAVHSLVANHYSVHPFFVKKINHHAPGEENAVKNLADLYDWDVVFGSCDTSSLLTPGSHYSPNYYNIYPYFNSVLFGRDWLLMAMALPVVRNLGAGNLAVGLEHDLLNTTYEYQGRTIYRYELQSSYGLQLIGKLINKVTDKNICLFSPLAGLSKVNVLRTIGKLFPDILRSGSFCFWSKNGPCGECIKCELNSIFEKALGFDLIPFPKNPLEKSWILTELNKAPENPAIHGRNELYWALNEIIGQSNTLDEPQVRIFNERHSEKYKDVSCNLNNELFKTYNDKLLPETYNSMPWGLH